VSAPTVINAPCAEEASMCVCALEVNHDGPHACACGGSWTGRYGDPLGPFEIVALPGSEAGYRP
jgi:hypothetical protein